MRRRREYSTSIYENNAGYNLQTTDELLKKKKGEEGGEKKK
jgi:hypothetical protein